MVVRSPGGGGKDGGVMTVGFCAVAAIVGAVVDEERCRCSKSTSIAVMRVSSTYRLGSAFIGPAYTLNFLLARSSTSSGVAPPVSGAAMTIFSGLSALGVMEMGKVVLALSRRVGWMR